MDTKHGKMEKSCQGLPPIKLYKFLTTWSREVTWKIKIIKSPIIKCLLSPIFYRLKLYDLTLVMWQIHKTITSSLSQGLLLLNLTGCWLQGGCSERKQLSRHRLLAKISIAICTAFKFHYVTRTCTLEGIMENLFW